MKKITTVVILILFVSMSTMNFACAGAQGNPLILSQSQVQTQSQDQTKGKDRDQAQAQSSSPAQAQAQKQTPAQAPTPTKSQAEPPAQSAAPGKGQAEAARQLPQGVAVADDSYVIGPEDVLFIHIWKEEALSRTIPVRIDGKISLPLVDDIQAAGLTPLQLKAALTEKLKDLVDNPTISVIVIEANSFKIYVSGQVKNPGIIRLRSETSLMQLITLVGGFTDWANQKKILIIRKEKGAEKRFTVNYKKLLEGERLEDNILLKAGDMVIVP